MMVITITRSVRARSLGVSAFVTAAMVLALGLDVGAVIVETDYVNINAGPADFGGPTHSFGGPNEDAAVTWDYDSSSGQLVATGRVRGTLYWDDLFSGGCTRLTISFRNQADNNLAVRIRDVCGPGGNANDSRNKLAIDESFSSSALTRIRIQTAKTSAGPAAGGFTIETVDLAREYDVYVTAGLAQCGIQLSVFSDYCRAGFSRENGTMSGFVSGPLRVANNKSGICARGVVTFRTAGNSVLDTAIRDTCGESFMGESFASGSLARIRIHVGELRGEDFVNTSLRTLDFNGYTGNFVAESRSARVAVHERMNYAFNWTVPEPLNWHDLASLELRIRDETETILHVQFDEATSSFRVLNEASGRSGNAFSPGSPVRLQSRHATLHLDSTSVGPVNSVLGSGPTSPTVRINLGLSFKPSAAGRTFDVFLAAKDDLGNEDEFGFAGTLTVD